MMVGWIGIRTEYLIFGQFTSFSLTKISEFMDQNEKSIAESGLKKENKTGTNLHKVRSLLNSRILDHLINAFLIFASVFLAFWLNDFRQKQIQAGDSESAMEVIINEVENNLAILERWTPYHLEMLERLEELFAVDSVQFIEYFDPSVLVDDYKGIMREILTRHAEALINSPSIQFALEDRMDVIMIYQQQKYVENALQRLIEMSYERAAMNPDRVVETYRVFYAMLSDLYGQEEAMIQNYQMRLDRLKNRN